MRAPAAAPPGSISLCRPSSAARTRAGRASGLVLRLFRLLCRDMSHWNRASTIKFLFLLLGAIAAAGVAAACRSTQSGTPAPAAVSPDTWASVDSRPITRTRSTRRTGVARDVSQTLSEEETITAKLSLLNDMIVQEILLARAGSLKVELPQSDLDTAYDNAKKNLSDEAHQQELTRRNLTAADMKEGLRREMLTQKVIEQEVGSKIVVSDKEITDFFAANRAQFNVAEESAPTSPRSSSRRCATRRSQRHRRRRHDAAGRGGEGEDADGAPQGRRLVPRSRHGLFGRS